jgi:nucleotide-binding universal stress UspA family protein
MKQILCVVDLSESTEKVLEVAARIANACKAHLIVLFPYRLIDYNHRGDIPSLKLKLESEAREKFQQLRRVTPGLATLPCELQVEIGFIADRINAHVRRGNIDMIVMGQQKEYSPADGKGFDLQHLITSAQLPFVIVPAAVKAEASV